MCHALLNYTPLGPQSAHTTNGHFVFILAKLAVLNSSAHFCLYHLQIKMAASTRRSKRLQQKQKKQQQQIQQQANRSNNDIILEILELCIASVCFQRSIFPSNFFEEVLTVCCLVFRFPTGYVRNTISHISIDYEQN